MLKTGFIKHNDSIMAIPYKKIPCGLPELDNETLSQKRKKRGKERERKIAIIFRYTF